MTILIRNAVRYVAWNLDVPESHILIGLPAGLVLFLVACALLIGMLGVPLDAKP